jgi:hypothetical protein
MGRRLDKFSNHRFLINLNPEFIESNPKPLRPLEYIFGFPRSLFAEDLNFMQKLSREVTML